MLVARPLNARTLAHHADRVLVPTYDRARLRRGVVHIGVGSFHRSHQADIPLLDQVQQREAAMVVLLGDAHD